MTKDSSLSKRRCLAVVLSCETLGPLRDFKEVLGAYVDVFDCLQKSSGNIRPDGSRVEHSFLLHGVEGSIFRDCLTRSLTHHFLPSIIMVYTEILIDVFVSEVIGGDSRRDKISKHVYEY